MDKQQNDTDETKSTDSIDTFFGSNQEGNKNLNVSLRKHNNN